MRVWASALTLGVVLVAALEMTKVRGFYVDNRLGHLEDDHACAPLPIGDDIITAVQEADPRLLTRAP